MVVLQLCLGSFQTKKRCSRLYSIKVDFYSKDKKIAFWTTLCGLIRVNVHTPYIARWKARGRLYICHHRTFFAISYGWDIISENRPKSAFFEGGGSLWAQISDGRRRRPPTQPLLVPEQQWFSFRLVSKYLQCII